MKNRSTPVVPIESYRELFPVTREKTWLNHASMGTLCKPVQEALEGFIRQHALGDFNMATDVALVERVRASAAAFIGADAAEIAFTKNVADGLNIIAHGLAWKEGDRVVIADQEFPANVYPWLNLEKQGVTVAKIRSDGGRVPLESILAAIGERTRLVSLSWVEFSTGFRNDLKAISSACRRVGAIFCVDGIQGVGAFPLNVRGVDIDVMATSSHKWLMAPAGVGWMYIRRELIDKIAVSYLGQSSVSRGASLDYLDFSHPLWPDARRFEPGILNYLGMVGLEASLQQFQRVGMERVRDRIKYLTNKAVEGLRTRGYNVISSRDGEEWSGAVSFDSKSFSASEIHGRLAAANVVISLRNAIVRLSPHYYNDEEDIERFLKALP